MVDVVFKSEVAAEDDSQVTDVWGWRQGGVVDRETEVMGVLCEGFRADEHQVGFIVVELEEVGLHPGLNISEAAGQGGGCSFGR